MQQQLEQMSTKVVNQVFDQVVGKFRRAPLSTLPSHQGKKNLYVAAYPISGNTWTSYVLTYCLNVQFYDVDREGLTEFTEGFRPYLEGNNAHPASQRFDRVLKTHSLPSKIPLGPEDKVVAIVRDVRDVVNSYYHRLLRRWPDSTDWKRRTFIKVADRAVPERVRYPIAVKYFARQWADYTQDALASGAIIVKYEDLLADQYNVMTRVLSELDPVSLRPDILRQGIELFALSEMKKQAAKAGENHPVRSGGAGDWRNYFSASDEEWIKEHLGELTAQLGYQ